MLRLPLPYHLGLANSGCMIQFQYCLLGELFSEFFVDLVAFSSLLYLLYICLPQNLTALTFLWLYLISVGFLRIRNIFTIVIPPASNLMSSNSGLSSHNLAEILKIAIIIMNSYKNPRILDNANLLIRNRIHQSNLFSYLRCTDYYNTTFFVC